MARGGRSGGHHGGHHGGFGHHGSSFGHHHHYSSGRGGGISFEASMDLLASTVSGPIALNGVYTLTGNQMSVLAHLDNYAAVVQQNASLNGPPIYQATLTIVGNKTSATNNCCFCMTICCGAFLIFPLCFMCCGWWKKIVLPKYEINAETYRSIGRLISNPSSTITNLTLTVVDNAFNAEKARILYEIISQSRLTGFTFNNLALACNYQASEADDFVQNMTALKSLTQVTSSCIWDDMII